MSTETISLRLEMNWQYISHKRLQ